MLRGGRLPGSVPSGLAGCWGVAGCRGRFPRGWQDAEGWQAAGVGSLGVGRMLRGGRLPGLVPSGLAGCWGVAGCWGGSLGGDCFEQVFYAKTWSQSARLQRLPSGVSAILGLASWGDLAVVTKFPLNDTIADMCYSCCCFNYPIVYRNNTYLYIKLFSFWSLDQIFSSNLQILKLCINDHYICVIFICVFI